MMGMNLCSLLPGSAAAAPPPISSYPIKPSSSSPLSVFRLLEHKKSLLHLIQRSRVFSHLERMMWTSNNIRWGLQRNQLAYTGLQRSDRHTLRVLANTNAPRGKGSKSDNIMVDPLEAKRLAAKQMQEIQAREKLKRQRQIEAINGAWAMIGLTAGLVVEGQTGHGILAQVAGYFEAITNFFTRWYTGS